MNNIFGARNYRLPVRGGVCKLDYEDYLTLRNELTGNSSVSSEETYVGDIALSYNDEITFSPPGNKEGLNISINGVTTRLEKVSDLPGVDRVLRPCDNNHLSASQKRLIRKFTKFFMRNPLFITGRFSCLGGLNGTSRQNLTCTLEADRPVPVFVANLPQDTKIVRVCKLGLHRHTGKSLCHVTDEGNLTLAQFVGEKFVYLGAGGHTLDSSSEEDYSDTSDDENYGPSESSDEENYGPSESSNREECTRDGPEYVQAASISRVIISRAIETLETYEWVGSEPSNFSRLGRAASLPGGGILYETPVIALNIGGSECGVSEDRWYAVDGLNDILARQICRFPLTSVDTVYIGTYVGLIADGKASRLLRAVQRIPSTPREAAIRAGLDIKAYARLAIANFQQVRNAPQHCFARSTCGIAGDEESMVPLRCVFGSLCYLDGGVTRGATMALKSPMSYGIFSVVGNIIHVEPGCHTGIGKEWYVEDFDRARIGGKKRT